MKENKTKIAYNVLWMDQCSGQLVRTRYISNNLLTLINMIQRSDEKDKGQ